MIVKSHFKLFLSFASVCWESHLSTQERRVQEVGKSYCLILCTPDYSGKELKLDEATVNYCVRLRCLYISLQKSKGNRPHYALKRLSLQTIVGILEEEQEVLASC
jgi:hypothetical protein